MLHIAIKHKSLTIMTSMELRQEFFRQIAVVSDDEGMMRKAIKALKRITKCESTDEALMSREEFKARVEQAAHGDSKSFASVEELDKYVRAL